MSADPGTLADMAPFARAGLSNDTICGWFQPPAWHTRNISTSADGLASGLRLAAACALGGWTLCMMDLVATPCLATVGFVYQGPMGCLAATITGLVTCCYRVWEATVLPVQRLRQGWRASRCYKPGMIWDKVAGEWQAPGDAATPPPATAASPNSLADIPSDTCSGSDEDDTHACLDAAANDNQQQVQEWGVSRARDQAPRCGPTAPGVPSAGAPGIQPPYKWQQHML